MYQPLTGTCVHIFSQNNVNDYSAGGQPEEIFAQVY